ncbi:MAG: cation-transporting P-type ATPase, partial [Oligoflexales bacterium]|nr:cation-transporting P-type ATPase [Oligoflexales bacterium]
MARRKALVRRAVSVENIGRVTCICSDKTGTITEGKLRLAHTFTSGGSTEDELMLAAAYASRKDSHDPLDEAILAALPEVDSKFEVIALFPFTEASRRETSVISIEGHKQAFSKGSPEVILRMCNLAASEIEQQEKNIVNLAKEGHKIIACAGKSLVAKEWSGEEPVSSFNFLGILAFEDPVRSEVPAAILACKNADIHVLMITGDHPETARTIAKEIGMGADHDIRVLNAEEVDIESLPAEHFMKIDVVARALPSQKLKVVTRLKASGEIVAVTGDGINDVPALKAADIGMAMGLRGTKPAREVSSIVLLDDNFATIVAGIAEGRQLLINLRSSFQYLVAVHIPLVLTSALIPLFGFPLLYLPIHIVWLELIIHPTALFAFQNEASKNLVSEKKYKFKNVFSKTDWLFAMLIGLSVTVAVGVAYIIGDPGTTKARTLALGTLIGANILTTLLFSAFRNWPSKLIGGIVLISSGVIFLTTQSTKILHLAPLNSSIDWLYIFGLSALSTLLPYGLLRFFSSKELNL